MAGSEEVNLDLGPLPLVFGGGSIGGLYRPVTDEAAAQTLAAAWEVGARAATVRAVANARRC